MPREATMKIETSNSTTAFRFLLEKMVQNPSVFGINGSPGSERLYIYDKYNQQEQEPNGLQSNFYLTPNNCHYVRHCLRAIDSATTRFNDTIDTAGNRLKPFQLPKNLWDASRIETLKDAQILAIERFTDCYDPGESWPNATVSLATETAEESND